VKAVACKPLERKVPKIHRTGFWKPSESKPFSNGKGIYPVIFRQIAKRLFKSVNDFGIKGYNRWIIRLKAKVICQIELKMPSIN